MMKTLAAVTVLGLLATPAAAQPAPPPRQPLAVKLTIKVNADTRTHELQIFDDGCGRIEDKSSAYEDEIKVCARPGATGFTIEVECRTRNGGTEYRANGSSVMKKGGRIELGRTGGTRFTLQLI